MKKKLLWVSQSPTAFTGLGKSARYILNGLKSKFDVISTGYNFDQKNIEFFGIDYEIQGLDLKNNSADPSSLGDQVKEYIIRYKPDVVVFFGDVRYFLYIPSIIRDIPDTMLVGYITVDCANLPLAWLPTISTFDSLIVTSDFAKQEIKRAYNRDSDVIYLGYNPEIFNLNNKGRAGGMETKQLVTLRVDRNQSRKNWGATFDIWNRWCSDKDVSFIYHTKLEPEDAGAPNLKEYMYNLPHFREKSACSKNYIAKEEDFSRLIKSVDVFFTTSMGEGFGLSILECAACGIPSVGIDFSASGELLRNGAGIAVPPASYFVNSEGVKMVLPNEHFTLEVLDRLYADKKILREASEKAKEWAKPYTWQNTISMLSDELNKPVGSSILKMKVLGAKGVMKI